MRTTTYASVQFAPGDPGGIQDWQALQRYLQDLERRTALAVATLANLQWEVAYSAPDKPRQGLVVYADGTQWNPGGGEGFYYYNSVGQWIQLG